jgi:hypothetical protein
MIDNVNETIREKKIVLFFTEKEALKSSFYSLICCAYTGELRVITCCQIHVVDIQVAEYDCQAK